MALFLCVTGYAAEQGDDNPTGVSGAHNGSVTTGGSYDPYTGNAQRVVDDIVVPGTVGAYPLKWTRFFNSHCTYAYTSTGGRWRYSYIDYAFGYGSRNIAFFPDGRALDFNVYSGPLPGVPDYVDNPYPYQEATLRLADGGKVIFLASGGIYNLSKIVDPYGLETTVVTTGSGSSKTTKITEPGGRYLLVGYDANENVARVDAFDGVAGHPAIQSVVYTWSNFLLSSGSVKVLSRVDYGDGTFARYTYVDRGYPMPPTCSQPPTQYYSRVALLGTCDDVRYAGPMRQIAYQYQSGNNGTRVLSETNLVTGDVVSNITGVSEQGTSTSTETRGDGPTRTFHYYSVPRVRNCTGTDEPPTPQPTDGKLQTCTDFLGRTTTLGYTDPGYTTGFVTSVTDANGHKTVYERGALIGEVYTITHPDNSTISQSYSNPNNPYFLASRTDENGHRTDYSRDANNRIIRKDYPADPNGLREYETFTYNNFGEIVTHRMRTGAYQHFAYDGSTSLTLPPGSRGLLTDKSNPTWTSDPVTALATEPKTNYTYYTSADFSGVWTDRVKTEADPRGLVTKYEYDRVYDANGENSGASTAQAPVSGRGLVTRLTHVSDGSTYQSFGYDKYGNKVWQANEMQQRTSYQHDEYGRVTSVKDPLLHTTTNSYVKPGQTRSDVTTHNQPFATTLPAGEVTNTYYDANWRKTRVQQAPGVPNVEANTWFDYDFVGNPTKITDPRGTGLGDPNYTTTTDYDVRDRKWHVTDPQGHVTRFVYDAASNVTSIVRPDLTTELKTYDQMNRVLTDTVPQTSTINVVTTLKYYPGNVQYGGLLWQIIDAKNQTTTFSLYEPSGLKKTVTYPNGDYHSFGYDPDFNLTSRRTAGGHTQSFTYDPRNRKATMAWDNNLDSASFGYDPVSRLTSAQNPTSTITRVYDAAGRLTLDRQNLANSPLGNKDVQYVYDADDRGQQLYLTSAGYDYSFSYDAMGRFEKISPTGGAVSFQYYYDAASNEIERFNYLNSVGQFYTRDNLSRMTERDVKLTTSVISSEAYGYDVMSRLITTDRQDGKRDQFGYLLDGELNSAQYAQPTPTPSVTPTPPPNQCAPVVFRSSGGGATTMKVYMSTPTTGATIFYTVSTADYVTPTHNGGAVTGTTKIYTGPVSVAVGAEKFFEAVVYKSGMNDSVFTDFDADNTRGGGYAPTRLGAAALAPSSAGRIVTYDLDQMGNRNGVNGVVDNGVATSYTPNNLNQYTGVGGANNVLNDNDHAINSYQGTNYTYINDERLSSVISGANNYQLAYDALGRCVKRMLNNAVTYYVYDGEKPIVEYSSTGAITAKNLYGKGIDENLLRTDLTVTPNCTLYYQDDHEGSVTHLTDATGAVVERYRYDVFGAPSIEDANGNSLTASALGNRFMFTGREYKWQFGIYEYRARAYHPGLGRFTSEDPKGFAAGDYNLFRYCHNDPEDLTDPMGLDANLVRDAIDRREVTGSHILVSQENLIASRQLFGLDTTAALAAQSAKEGLRMGQVQKSGASNGPDRAPNIPVRGGTYEQRKHYREVTKEVLRSDRGQDYINKVRERGYAATIHLTKEYDAYADDAPSKHVRVDPSYHPVVKTTAGPLAMTDRQIIGHEFGHAIMGTKDDGPRDMNNVRLNENPIRAFYREPLRTEY